MKYKKKDLDEIIDGTGNLIGNDGIPSVDANADTQAKHTTDYNAKVGTQPFRYDMLGRFGFSMMPFMEGEEKNQAQNDLFNELTKYIYDRYVDVLKQYYKNPNKLKIDYRKISAGKGDDKYGSETAKEILKIVEKHFEKQFKNLDEQFRENIAENKVVEDIMVKKSSDKMSKKSDDHEVREKKLEKIAGLINKLEKKDIDKLINLLEIKKNG